MDGAHEYEQINDLVLGDMLELLQSKSEKGQPPEPAFDATRSHVSDIFETMNRTFQPDAARNVDVVFQFSISGGDGGDWIVAVKEGVCRIEPGIHPKPSATISLAGSDFLMMMSGSLSAMQAYALGKIKISGDLMKAQLIEKLFKL